jgi:hypothetical protein
VNDAIEAPLPTAVASCDGATVLAGDSNGMTPGLHGIKEQTKRLLRSSTSTCTIWNREERKKE